MTDKQIIIDSVDVSGCKNFSCGKCEEENKIPITINHFTADCRMYPNCYYKQLKRKEQECEELKEKYKWYDHYKEQALYNKNLCNEKSEQLDQLKQTLTEIKEIAEKDFRHTAWEEYAKQLKQILQKINEVEEQC